jgi:hypothetical protein
VRCQLLNHQHLLRMRWHRSVQATHMGLCRTCNQSCHAGLSAAAIRSACQHKHRHIRPDLLHSDRWRATDLLLCQASRLC